MSTTTLYVPCDVVRVRVTLGYGDRLSPIESVMMEALLGRPDGVAVEDLLSLFKLGQRVTLDLLGDLLRRGYIVVDFGKATVRLAPGIDRSRLDKLQGAERFNSTVDLMIDRLVGAVFTAEEGRHQPGDYRLRVPAPVAAYQDEITEPQLLAVLDRAADQNRSPGGEKGNRSRPQKVLAARLTPDDLGARVEQRWLSLEVSIRADEDTQRLRFVVVDRRLSTVQRELAAKRLGQLVADLPETRFAQTLQGAVDRTFVDPPTLRELLTRFAGSTAVAASAAPGTRTQRHKNLRADYRAIATELRAARDAEAEAFAVVGREHHDDVVAQLISAAKRQLVLVCPTLHYDVFQRYFKLLEAALARGVQIVLVWGDDREAELQPKVSTALSTLQWRNEGVTRARMLSSGMPSRLNAAAVIADDRQALVTGYHFLRLEDPARQQLGLHVRAPDAGPCLPIESLLSWARRTLQHQHGQLMFVHHRDFQVTAAGDPPRAAGHAKVWPESEVALPDPPPEGAADELTTSQIRLWAEQWQAVSAKFLQLASSRKLPQVRLVEDAAHRELLWDALRQPGRRLVLGGLLAHPDALNERLLKMLDEQAAAGRRISLRYQRSTAAGTGRDAHATLQGLGGGHPVSAERQPTNARVLVSDDWAVVTSFDFMGSSGRTTARYRDRAELGLQVTGGGVADEIVRSLGISDVQQPRTSTTQIEEMTAVEYSTAGRLLGAVANLPAADRAGVVIKHLPEDEQGWQVLEDLHHVDAPADILRVAAAAVLRRTADRSTTIAQRWLSWLTDEAFNRRAFVEAALLRSAVLDPTFRPRAGVAAVAAVRGGPGLGRAVVDAWTDDLVPAEHTALAVVAAANLLLADEQPALLNGLVDNDVPELLQLFDLTQPWSDLISLTGRYWKSALSPLPMPVIRAGNADADRQHGLDSAWQNLSVAVDQCRNARLGFKLASRHLFGPAGTFGPIVTAVEERDVEAVRGWIDGVGGTEAQEQFSRAEHEAAGLRKPTPAARTQPYVDRMRRIQTSARKLLRHHDEGFGHAQDTRTEPARILAGQLHRLWSRLCEEVVDGPEKSLVTATLDELAFVERWGAG